MIEELKKLKVGKIIENVNLEKYTSYKLNEKAKAMVFVDSLDNLKKLLHYLNNNSVKYKIVGGCSNLIFDGFYDGVLIKLDMQNYTINGKELVADAGCNLMMLANKVSKKGLTGMEFATGIPGTLGGAIYNNSGAYGSDMGYIVKEVTVLKENEIFTIPNKNLDYHYRTSLFKKETGYIILSVKIVLKSGDKNQIKELIMDRLKRRKESQPLEYPSAGSVFRNPTGLYAGKLIEDVNMKGYNLNGAEVSMKHANFIINKGNAKGTDIVKLINLIKEKVNDKYNVDLVLEQEIVK